MKNECLYYSWCGFVTLLLLNVSGSWPVNAASYGAIHASHTQKTQRTSTIEAKVEFEETDSALVRLREHNGRYTLSATYLDDKGDNSEFSKHVVDRRPITRRDYFTICNALKASGFWQAPSMHWPASARQAGRIAGIIQIEAASGSRRHGVAEYVSMDGTWLGSRAEDRRRDAIRRVAGMIVALAERPARAR